jgi:hypothetical protein
VQRAILCVVNAKVRNRIDFPKKGVYCVEKITCIKKNQERLWKRIFSQLRSFVGSWRSGSRACFARTFFFLFEERKTSTKKKEALSAFRERPSKAGGRGFKAGRNHFGFSLAHPFPFRKVSCALVVGGNQKASKKMKGGFLPAFACEDPTESTLRSSHSAFNGGRGFFVNLRFSERMECTISSKSPSEGASGYEALTFGKNSSGFSPSWLNAAEARSR